MYPLTPEERVRQALVWFLVERSRLKKWWNTELRLEVERSSYDVAAFFLSEGYTGRLVLKLPIVIVETKRPEINLLSDVDVEEQLRTYMRRGRCRNGFLFNTRQAAWVCERLDGSRPVWSTVRILDLTELEQELQNAMQAVACKVRDVRAAFGAAAGGDFDAMMRLVSLMGSDSRLNFTLSIRYRGGLSAVQAFNVCALDSEELTYRQRGVLSSHRQHVVRRDFHSIVSLHPI
jgi:hypothetical protein